MCILYYFLRPASAISAPPKNVTPPRGTDIRKIGNVGVRKILGLSQNPRTRNTDDFSASPIPHEKNDFCPIWV